VTTAIALGAALAVGVAVLLATNAFAATTPAVRPEAFQRWAFPTQRLVLGVACGALVMLLTGWVPVGLAACALVVLWGRIFSSSRAAHERRRLEAIAKWLEDIRDLVRGSGLSLEQALEQTAGAPPMGLREELTRFAARCRHGWDREEALMALADELDHPTADAAIAAVLMAIGTSGARLVTAVTTLAEVARDEVAARERSDRLRSIYESSMRRLIAIAVAIIGFLRISSAELLAPLARPAGQAWLVLPLAVWAGCLWWLRRLSHYELPRRYRLRANTGVRA
jgi:tight adherence protein B